MRSLKCEHCGGNTEVGDKICTHCGMPLSPNHGKNPQKKFILWFIVLVVFCLFMMFWLPPDWTRFLEK